MINIRLHEAASKSFNERAQSLIESVLKQEVEQSDSASEKRLGSDPYQPYISTTITEKDIIGTIVEKHITRSGSLTFIRHITDDYVYSIVDKDSLAEFEKFCDSIWRASNISSYVKKEFVIDTYIRWISSGAQRDFIDFLVDCISAIVKECKVLIPLHAVQLRKSIQILDCLVRPVSVAEINGWFEGLPSDIDSTETRKLVQGKCVVECKLVADPSHAISEALLKAKQISMIFAFYSPFTFIPDGRFNGLPIGQEVSTKHSVLVFDGSGPVPNTHEGIDSTDDYEIYHLDDEKLRSMEENCVVALAHLFKRGKKSDFETRLRNSISLFMRSALTNSSTEKLTFGVVALESLLIRTDSEAISQNLAERLAFFMGNGLEERRGYINTVKTAYAMRSAYVHHGRSAEDLETISQFLILVFLTLVQALRNISMFRTKEDFLNAIDDKKLSG